MISYLQVALWQLNVIAPASSTLTSETAKNDVNDAGAKDGNSYNKEYTTNNITILSWTCLLIYYVRLLAERHPKACFAEVMVIKNECRRGSGHEDDLDIYGRKSRDLHVRDTCFPSSSRTVTDPSSKITTL